MRAGPIESEFFHHMVHSVKGFLKVKKYHAINKVIVNIPQPFIHLLN